MVSICFPNGLAAEASRAVSFLFEAFHEGEQIVDLVWIEMKGGHGGVTGIDSLRKSLCKRLYLVAPMKIAEWGSNCQWARIEPVDGVTARTICFCENEPALLAGRCGFDWRRQDHRDRQASVEISHGRCFCVRRGLA